jgi:RHS repeat-associated protein
VRPSRIGLRAWHALHRRRPGHRDGGGGGLACPPPTGQHAPTDPQDRSYQGDRRQYAYDPANNLTTRTINGATTAYQYTQANELIRSGDTTWSYDENGNETGNSDGLVLTYNAKDQTKGLLAVGASEAANMDYLGPNQLERISEGTVNLKNSILGIARRNQTATPTGPVYFTRDDEGGLVGARPTSGAKYYYLFDGLGSVVGLTDSSGTLLRSYRYDPYGSIMSNVDHTGTAPVDRFRFTGGYQGMGGLYHFGFRYYQPDVARWTQQDAIDTPADLREANRYSYVGGNPVNSVDLSGLHSVGQRIASGAAGTIAFGAGVGFGFAAVTVYEGCGAFADEATCIKASAPVVSASGTSFLLSGRLWRGAFHRHHGPRGDFSPCGDVGLYCRA